ncbi:MAG: hypothetical protein HUJ96_07290 [Marinilabiliaceae bacterium]|nr:hypothetical protein [Marinilabiliaceae bacterium]
MIINVNAMFLGIHRGVALLLLIFFMSMYSFVLYAQTESNMVSNIECVRSDFQEYYGAWFSRVDSLYASSDDTEARVEMNRLKEDVIECIQDCDVSMQVGLQERARGMQRRIVGNAMLCITFLMIVVLIFTIWRNNKSNKVLRRDTSEIASKNIVLTKQVELLQGTNESLQQKLREYEAERKM